MMNWKAADSGEARSVDESVDAGDRVDELEI